LDLLQGFQGKPLARDKEMNKNVEKFKKNNRAKLNNTLI
jgi:hypothetical protein